ncbi:unknown [Salmonella phage FelixO1]|uniref:Uncharacterized protein n=1 Tax=Salmonella phage Felix O1 (isolate Felix O1-VT1) TaxID=1283336 RepID=Q6KGQ8_BPFO1|nr:unknown [Salmonella phage FelixO1]
MRITGFTKKLHCFTSRFKTACVVLTIQSCFLPFVVYMDNLHYLKGAYIFAFIPLLKVF